MTDIAADVNTGNGDKAQARIFYFARNHNCQLALDLIAYPLGAAILFAHDVLYLIEPCLKQQTARGQASVPFCFIPADYRVRATSIFSNTSILSPTLTSL